MILTGKHIQDNGLQQQLIKTLAELVQIGGKQYDHD
jgi:hypothetical protein